MSRTLHGRALGGRALGGRVLAGTPSGGGGGGGGSGTGEGRTFGGRAFGGRAFGARTFGRMLVADDEEDTVPNANPVHLFAWPVYSDRSAVYTPTVAGGAWRTGLPAQNVLNDALSKVARSLDVTLESTQMTGDLLVERSIRVAALHAHTGSRAALMRWSFSNTAGDFSEGVAEYISDWTLMIPSSLSDEDRYGINVPALCILPAEIDARYWKFEIDDTTNARGVIDIGRAMVCGAWSPSVGISAGARLELSTATTRALSDGGATLYDRKPIRRAWNVTINNLSEAEAFANAQRMQRIAGLDKQFFFVYDAGDTALTHERSFPCTFSELGPLEFAATSRISVSLRCVEVL